MALVIICGLYACKKDSKQPTQPSVPASFSFNALKVNGIYNGFNYNGANTAPVIKLSFSAAINHNTINNNITFKNNTGTVVTYTAAYQNNDSTVVITPSALQPITQYVLNVSTGLQSAGGGSLQSALTVNLTTAIDTTNKFPVITDNALLDTIQKRTFKYFCRCRR